MYASVSHALKNARIHIQFAFFVLLVGSFFIPFHSQARWATHEEAPLETEYYKRDIDVDSDGSFVDMIHFRMKILNEEGRRLAGIYAITSMGEAEKIEILEASTSTMGRCIPVDKKLIETKSVASEIEGFDDVNKTQVAFSNVEIGSSISIKYRKLRLKNQTTKKKGDSQKISSADKLNQDFTMLLEYGRSGIWKSAETTIRSRLPLEVKVNDPGGHIELTNKKDGQYQLITIHLKKPCLHKVVSETSTLDSRKLTWVSISSFKTVEELGAVLSAGYEEVLKDTLPDLYLDIRSAAEKIKDPIDQINLITSKISELIRYLGDWRTIQGAYKPRSLTDITNSRIGDCKDFSVSTAAILRSLGYKVSIAVVMRGKLTLPVPFLPAHTNYNHAMLKVTTPGEKVLWIDPTNFVSMANGLFHDISGREALVLDPKDSKIERIPDIDPKHARIETTQTWFLQKDGQIKRVGKVLFKGEEAIDLTGARLLESPQRIEEEFFRDLTDQYGVVDREAQFPDLRSRIVRDLELKYSFTLPNQELFTNEGIGLPLDEVGLQPYTTTQRDQVGDLIARYPHTITRKYLIKNVIGDTPEKLNVEIKTPWVEAKRTCRQVGEDIEILVDFSVLKSIIPVEEIQSEAFQKLKNDLNRYFRKVAVIMKPKEKARL